MTVAFSTFYDYILPDTPGVGFALADFHIRETIEEFLRRTRLLEYTLPAVSTVATQAAYPLTPSETYYKIIDIFDDGSARLNNLPLDPASPTMLDSLYQDWRLGETGNLPGHYYTDIDYANGYLVPTPSEVIPNLIFKVAQTLTKDATVAPDFMLERYYECVADGVKGRLMAMQNKPWTNPSAAKWYLDRFEQGIGKGDVKRHKAHTRVSLRTRSIHRPTV